MEDIGRQVSDFLKGSHNLSDLLGIFNALSEWLRVHVNLEFIIKGAKFVGTIMVTTLEISMKFIKWILALLPQ